MRKNADNVMNLRTASGTLVAKLYLNDGEIASLSKWLQGEWQVRENGMVYVITSDQRGDFDFALVYFWKGYYLEAV